MVHLNCRARSGTCRTRGSQRICPSVLGLQAAGLLSLWAGPSVWDSLPEGTGQVRGPPAERVLGHGTSPHHAYCSRAGSHLGRVTGGCVPRGGCPGCAPGPCATTEPVVQGPGRAEACEKQPWAQASGQLVGVMALGCGEQS